MTSRPEPLGSVASFGAQRRPISEDRWRVEMLQCGPPDRLFGHKDFGLHYGQRRLAGVF